MPAEPTKPLILLEPLPAAEILRTRVPKVEPALAAAAAAAPDSERCFRKLLADGERREATRFLAAALKRRVQVWWGYSCLRELRRYSRAHRAALAASGGGVIGLMAAAATAPAIPPLDQPAGPVFGVDPDPGIDRREFEPRPPVVDGVDLSDPAAWPKPSVGPDGVQRFLPPVLEPVRDHPLRRPDACDAFWARRQAFIDALGPEERAAFLAHDAKSGEVFAQVFGGSAAEVVGADREHAFAASGVGAYDDPQAPHSRIKAAMEAKKAEVQAAIGGWMQRMQGVLGALPKARPSDLSGDTQLTSSALESVRTWVLNPVPENGRAAMALGEKCEGMEQAAGFLAMACHFSGSDLNPPGMPADTPPVPPPPAVAPNLIFTALELARHIPDTGRTPDEWQEAFLELGMKIAQGLHTWDAALHERPDSRHPWAGRSGFGRLHAQHDAPPPSANAP